MKNGFSLGLAGAATLALTACGGGHPPGDPRGVDHDETLLSVSASGRAETRPDMASFTAGVQSFGSDSKAATANNATAMNKLVAALEKEGIAEKDIQTQNLSVNLVDYGPHRGQYEANNQVSVRVRKVDTASKVIGAATAAGANIVSGPSLSLSDPEKAKLSAYGAAYKAARARADAYAEAAGMEVSRVLAIRDGGAQVQPPMPYEYAAADAVMANEAAPPVRVGTDISEVTVSVDFALERK